MYQDWSETAKLNFNVAGYGDSPYACYSVFAGPTRTQAQIDIEHNFCTKYLNPSGEEIHWDFIRALLASGADTAIIPLQDLLGLGTEGRMNLPNSTEGN